METFRPDETCILSLGKEEKSRRKKKRIGKKEEGLGAFEYDSSPFNLFLLIPVSVAWFAISLYQDFMNVFLKSAAQIHAEKQNNTSNTVYSPAIYYSRSQGKRKKKKTMRKNTEHLN